MSPTFEDANDSATTYSASTESVADSVTAALTPLEELLLQQLQQVLFWAEKKKEGSPHGTPDLAADLGNEVRLPECWDLTRGFVLHDWQEECVQKWFDNGRRGVIKVVTGAGKTILALAIAQRLQKTHPTLRLAIVVPTIVLLNQWLDELADHSNLPAQAIGLMGGGNQDGFAETTRILICVLNSAAKKLSELVQHAGIGDDLLLIVDECHRAGAAEMKKVFRTRRAFSLGLSATPERTDDPAPEDEDNAAVSDEKDATLFDDSTLGQELGPVVYELNYAQAISRGVLPPFQIVHYGLSLGPKERETYDGLCRQIKDLRQELETKNRKGLALIRWCRSPSGAKNPRALQFLSLTSERKRLLYRMEDRFNTVLQILRRAVSRKPDTKAILFHESIDEVMGLFARLRKEGYAVVAEHSGFPDAMRAESLRLFRKGTASVIVSAKSLIEGFNVPSADLGIIVAASASVRQRVQTLGRLLRRNRTQDGSEKQATLYVLYAAGTVDELIYEKADWEQFVGADRNDYFLWRSVNNSEPLALPGPPRRPPLDESKIDASILKPGDQYVGDPDQGDLYSIDTQGTVRDENGSLLKAHEQLRGLLQNHHKSAGRFRVTPKNRFVTKLEKTPDGWQAIYLGRLDLPLELAVDQNGTLPADPVPGVAYPLNLATGKVFSVLQRDRRLIARKLHGQVHFVVPADQLADPEKQKSLRQIQSYLAEVYARGHHINKITVNDAGHAIYVFNNEAYFVGFAPEGAEGFMFESPSESPAQQLTKPENP